MSEHFDELEVRDPGGRETALLAAVRDQIAHAKTNALYFTKHLRDVDPRAITDRAALGGVPVTRKSNLIEQQRKDPPFGGLAAAPIHRLGRIFQSPGPIYDPEGFGKDYWRFGRAM